MARYALFAFRADPSCLRHALLYAEDFVARGHTATVILEGPATLTAAEAHEKPVHVLHKLYGSALEAGLIGGFCLACSKVSGAFEALSGQGLPALDELLGHPSPARFIDSGWEVLVL